MSHERPSRAYPTIGRSRRELGKDDWPRPMDKKKYDRNYDRIFRKKKEKK